MKQVFLILMALFFILTACDSGITEEVESAKDSFDKSAQEKIWVCHVDSETGDVILLSVSGNSNHLGNPNHAFGDLEDYEPVFSIDNLEEAKADDNRNGVAGGCEIREPIWAAAYIDADVDDGSYDPEVDILIAKLVDNGDGVIGSGDQVITDKYPMDFDLDNGTGDFTRTTHVTTTAVVLSSSPVAINAFSAEGEFFGFRAIRISAIAIDGYFELTYTDDSGGYEQTSAIDYFNVLGLDDFISTLSGSPSRPSSNINENRVSPGDDAFIDVEIYLPE